LKLWHPYIPFVTEHIWEQFNDSQLIIEKWPVVIAPARRTGGRSDSDVAILGNDFDLIQEIISSIRNARAENKVEPSQKVEAVILAGDRKDLILEQAETIKGLRTGIVELKILDTKDGLDL